MTMLAARMTVAIMALAAFTFNLQLATLRTVPKAYITREYSTRQHLIYEGIYQVKTKKNPFTAVIEKGKDGTPTRMKITWRDGDQSMTWDSENPTQEDREKIFSIVDAYQQKQNKLRSKWGPVDKLVDKYLTKIKHKIGRRLLS
jgi:hypothetical protein